MKNELFKESLRDTPGYRLALEELVFPQWKKHVHSGEEILKLKFCNDCGRPLEESGND